MILYGASGHAEVIIDTLEKNKIPISYLIDDNPEITEIQIKYDVKHSDNIDFEKINEEIIFSIGNNKIRKKLALKSSYLKFGIAIHPNAIIGKWCIVDPGSVVMANAVLNANVEIKRHCIINTNAVIEHDCVIENYVHISPSATLCGNVTVGEGTHIGAGAIVIPNIKIGKWCTIGAGSVVIKDIPDHTTVVGNPARIVKKNT